MRRNSVRHFIHMVIDILPLLIIPIFALNILHKETEPISIETYESKEIDMYQLAIPNNNQNTTGGITYSPNNGIYYLNGTATSNNYYFVTLDDLQNHVYIVKGAPSTSSGTTYDLTLRANSSATVLATIYGEDKYFVSNQTYTDCSLVIRVFNGTICNNVVFKPQLFDLTEMFGLGNEPTIEQFNVWFTNNFYPYSEGKPYLVQNYQVTTYNSTDIGSQFVYALYKPVHDYFNFNNLFNMGAIYSWIELNLFSGTAPLPIFIIWNVIVYEFFVDLIFLLYGVFMFIIDFATQCVDRFTYKGRKGI